jgi:phosphatidylserine/phosphatidylglycerophosphate/cardiolipin synthase-like enzyme
MTELIARPFFDNFISDCRQAGSSIKLCAPFVKNDIIADIIDVKKSGTPLDLITKINLRSFHAASSDIGALSNILSNAGHVYNCSNLHAKIYIFDDSRCYITSANLTYSGLKNNSECGIFTTESALVRSTLKAYRDLQNHDDVGKITESILDDINLILSNIPSMPSIPYPKIETKACSNEYITAIENTLTGWKKDVFKAIARFDDTFTSHDIAILADELKEKHSQNHNREAKIRQVLQQLRDLGLVEFVYPGVYRSLQG